MMHSVSTLRYYLVKGRADLRALRIFNSRQVVWSGHPVTFCVLGTSHAVIVGCDRWGFTELLSCVPPVECGEVLEHTLARSARAVRRTVGRVAYSCSLTLCELTEAGQLKGCFERGDMLELTYETAANDPQPAVTRIGWRVTPSVLSVETVHTYPGEGHGIRSQSVFELVGG